MRIKKQYIFIGFAVLLILLINFIPVFFDNKKELPDPIPLEQNYIYEEAVPIKEISTKEKEKINIIENTIPETKIKVSLNVLDKEYFIETKENSSVFEVMKKIKEESVGDNSFDFKYTDNASLGSFVTEINGVKGTPGKYWIYYVNNKSASVGVSNYILTDGDIINWSQEGM